MVIFLPRTISLFAAVTSKSVSFVQCIVENMSTSTIHPIGFNCVLSSLRMLFFFTFSNPYLSGSDPELTTEHSYPLTERHSL